jgi:Family of unknown function (DUF6421)
MSQPQRKVARILFDESHNESWSVDLPTAMRMQPAHPADASYARAADLLRARDFCVERHLRGPLTPDTLAQTDLLVIAHPSDAKWERTTGSGSPMFHPAECEAIRDFVHTGGALLVMGETEQDKYGSNLNTLLAPFGIALENTTLFDHSHCDREVPSWVMAAPAPQRGLTQGVTQASFLRAGAISAEGGDARLMLRAHASASVAQAGLLATAQAGAGRVAVFADSDLFGDDDISRFDHQTLWLNTCYWLAEPAFARHAPAGSTANWLADPSWLALKRTVNSLRGLQQKDGALAPDADRVLAGSLVAEMQTAIKVLSPKFPHESAYLGAVLADLEGWVAGGFVKPDFTAALAAFRPELSRADGIEHLVVFPLYTPNGSPETRFEALITRTPWPDFVAELERTRFDNAKFVPVHLVDHTDGYASECAVLFPETVSVAGRPTNTFGGIFCDREAARYQRVVSAACNVLDVNLPPQAQSFLRCLPLIQDTFVLWDLIHDRWHSHGELPFDPFMIRQRLPYWMYALEELRVDLQTYGSASELVGEGLPFAQYVKYGILFDRLFRFPITGNRVRNYDGLSGQLLFGYLHRNGVVTWRDNALEIDWARLDEAMAGLRAQVEQLYRDGIDMTKVQYWLAGHDLVSEWVRPNLGSKWAKDTRVLSDESVPKAWIDRVLDDEFPLSLFFLQLEKKVRATGA